MLCSEILNTNFIYYVFLFTFPRSVPGLMISSTEKSKLEVVYKLLPQELFV